MNIIIKHYIIIKILSIFVELFFYVFHSIYCNLNQNKFKVNLYFSFFNKSKIKKLAHKINANKYIML